MSTVTIQAITTKAITLADVISKYVKAPPTSYDVSASMMSKTMPEYIEVQLPSTNIKVTLEDINLKYIDHDGGRCFIGYKVEVKVNYEGGGSAGSTFGIGRRVSNEKHELSVGRYIHMADYGLFCKHINEQTIGILNEVIDACLGMETAALPKYIIPEMTGVEEHKLVVALRLIQTGWFDKYLDPNGGNGEYLVSTVNSIYNDKDGLTYGYNVKRQFKLAIDRRVLVTTETGALQQHKLDSNGAINHIWSNTKSNDDGTFTANPPQVFLDQLVPVKLVGDSV